MIIDINLYKMGYFVGKYGAKVIRYVTCAKLAASGYSGVTKIAKAHKLISSSAEVVSENLFNCLEFID